MRYLVTGCAGFIASNVTRQLLADGHEVLGVDNLNDAYDTRLKDWRLAQLTPHPRFTFERADIARRDALSRVFASGPFDAVFNLAARAGVRQSLADPWLYVDTNVTGHLNVLDAARAHDVPKVVLASTSSLYGASTERPFRETTSTERPLSPYASSKKGAESLSASYAHLYGIDAPVLRYFTVYGPAGRPDMSVFRFIRWIAEGEPIVMHGDGSQERDFTFVDDIARGTILAQDVKGHEIINLGSDSPHKLSEMVSLVEKHLGARARIDQRPVHRADVRATWADIGKARTLLGWEPKYTLDEGIRACVEWYRENRTWASELELSEN